MSDQEQNDFAEVAAGNGAATCTYQDQEYGEGAVVCMNGREFICQNNGTWAPTGGEC